MNPTILIPAYKPEKILIQYAKDLIEAGFAEVIIVDDGSGEEFNDIFREAGSIPGVTLLRQEVNGGKGKALKTGFEYMMREMPQSTGVITADADGQHTVKDCLRLAGLMADREKYSDKVMFIGSRDFSNKAKGIPFRSRFGNRCTSILFKLLYGEYVPDTQTGLRGFYRESLEDLCAISGDRYEYEMRVLTEWAVKKYKYIVLPIETIYEGNNEGSHFNPIKDSWKIYKVLFGTFFRYTGISILSFLIDYLFFNLFRFLILPGIGMTGIARLDWTAGFTARLLSSVCNYIMNRRIVFKSKKKGSAIKFAVLCILNICISNAGVTLFELIGIPAWLMKPVCDTVLYFVNFKIQSKWVF